jgi:subtilisin family serine protease
MCHQKLTLILLVGIILFPTVASAIFKGGTAAPISKSEPTRLIVKFKSNVDLPLSGMIAGKKGTGIKKLDNIDVNFKIAKKEAISRHAENLPTDHPFKNAQIITVEPGTDIETLMSEYRKLDIVEYIEPDHQMELFTSAPPEPDPDPDPEPEIMPNDPAFLDQWNLYNIASGIYHVERLDGCNNDYISFPSSTFDADIDYLEVYQTPPVTAADAVVAIIDTGVDVEHPDLAVNIWHNTDEIAGNNIDDDKNGYIDDVIGWDFCDEADEWSINEDNDPYDYYGHGTHCAGLIAAVRDNLKGMAGICPRAKIMVLKVFPVAFTSICAKAVLYAANNGADVINMSWGGPYPSKLLRAAIVYAKAMGAIPVAAAGNSGPNTYLYPAYYPEVISVGATDANDNVTDFSSTNAEIDVVAPGRDIMSLKADTTDMYAYTPHCDPNIHVVPYDTTLYWADGTSMAAPHVVGEAAYIRAISPGLSPNIVQGIIQNSADMLPDTIGSGHGRINLRQALVDTPRRKAIIASPANSAVVSGMVNIVGSASWSGSSNYKLAYADSVTNANWTVFKTGYTVVNNSVLGILNTATIPGGDGPKVIRIQVGDNYDYVRVYVVNNSIAQITSPESNQVITGLIPITGSAGCLNFQSTIIEYKSNQESDWHTIETLNNLVYDGILAYWTVFDLDGEYSLCISVYAASGSLVASQTINNIKVNGDGFWTAPLSGHAGRIPNFGDFNGDGINEIVVGTSTGLKFFNLDGEAISLPNVSANFPEGNYQLSPVVGKLDNDNIDDIAAVESNVGTLCAYLSSGTFNPSTVVTSRDLLTQQLDLNDISSESLSPRLSLRDINNDGLDEIHYYTSHSYWIYTGSSTGRDYHYNVFQPNGTLIFDMEGRDRYLAADIDGNGYAEIFTTSQNGNNILIDEIDPYTENSIVQFNLPPAPDGIGIIIEGLSAVDIDQDGIEELIISACWDELSDDYDNLPYMLYFYDYNEGIYLMGNVRNTGIPRFSYQITHPVFGDLNGDNVLEYTIAAGTYGRVELRIYNLDGSGFNGAENGLYIEEPMDEAWVTASPILADFNGDNQTDIIIACGQDMENFVTKNEFIYIYDITSATLMENGLIPITRNYGGSNCGMFFPYVGDIDNDGAVDILFPSVTDKLVFMNFENNPYHPELATCPTWLYGRKLNASYIPAAGGQAKTASNDKLPLPASFALAQNNPNPFNPATEISFSLPIASDVKLEIFNILGERVKVLADGYFEAGTHTINWNADRSASGIYFYRIKAGEFVSSKKMVLLK